MPRRWLSAWVVLIVAGPLAAQVVAPPPPAEYDVELRYRIRTTRNERVRQFQEMIRSLDAAGLVRIPGEPDEIADPNAERLRGRLPSSAVERVLAEPHVRTLLLIPAGAKLPE